jgi:PKHD-type hydroxylase
MLLIEGFLGAEKLAELNNLLHKVPFVDGKATGGVHGSQIKNNRQADVRHVAYAPANSLVLQAIMNCEILQSYALPHVMTPVTFAKYGPGMRYADHVDAAIQFVPNRFLRTDISFTIFLAPPDSYEGGELVVNSMGAERAVKGNAGDMFVYHTGITHRVNEVTSGWRQVAIGWIQSLVAGHEHREILYDLLRARTRTLETEGRGETFDLINSAYVNLQRLFAQP